MEMESFQNDKYAKNYFRTQSEWRNSIIDGIGALNVIYNDMDDRLSFGLFHIVPYYYKQKKRNAFMRKWKLDHGEP